MIHSQRRIFLVIHRAVTIDRSIVLQIYTIQFPDQLGLWTSKAFAD